MIDSHPDDIAHIDFIKPDGTPKMATLGDERQLNDASFNAGLDSGSSYEWTDDRNRLKFYVIDKKTDAQGILHYKVAVKSLDGAGPQTRGVALQSAPAAQVAAGQWATCTFPLKNTGVAADVPANVHPQDSSSFLTSDVYRLLGRRQRHRLVGQGPQRADRREVRRVDVDPGLRHQGHQRLGGGHGRRSPRRRRATRPSPRPRSAACPRAVSVGASRRRWR